MALIFANNSSLANITELPSSISGGGLNLISTQTASASASLEFSMDSSYDSYVFKYIECNPATNATYFQFNLSTDSGSTYAVTKTSTHFWSYHKEDDTTTSLDYWSGGDLAQGTGDQYLSYQTANDVDAHVSGTLQIFNPSSTTFVKHYIARSLSYWDQNAPFDQYVAGYGNTTSVIDSIKFSFSSGNFDGIIKMYGVS